MKSILHLSLVFLCTFMCLQLRAQFPDNFEFLEHQHAKCTLGAYKVHNDAIYFASHNNYKPQTLVNKVSADGTFEVLLKPEFDAFRSQLFVQSDTSFQIVLFGLYDYDVLANGIYVVNVKGDDYSIDTIAGYDMFDNHQGIGFNNIGKDEDGNWITHADKMYRFDKTGIISTEEITFGLNNSKLFSNLDGDLFVIELIIDTKSILSSYKNGILTELATFDEDIPVTPLSVNETGIYLAVGGKILHYNQNFSALLNSWETDLVQGDIKSANYNDRLEFLTTTGEKYFLYAINGNDEMELVYHEENNESEKISEFTKLSDDQYLFTGTYSIEDISRNIFIRNINIIDNSQTVYSKADVAIIDSEITLAKKDTYDIIVSLPDTFYSVLYQYEIEVTLSNESSEDVAISNAFSQKYSYYPYHVNLEVDSFPANSTLTKKTISTNLPLRNQDEFTFAIPGANYKFNKNDNKVFTAKYMSAVSNIKPTKHLSVYPNPVADNLKLDIDKTESSVTIFDLHGRMMYYNLGQNQEVDVSSLKSGNYILSVKSSAGKNLSLGKFIKL